MSARFDPQVIHGKLLEAGSEWADAQYICDLLTETRKTVLSKVAASLIESGDARSMTQAIEMARGSTEYENHVADMVEARREAHKSRVVYDSARAWFDAIRTQAANQRVETQTLKDFA